MQQTHHLNPKKATELSQSFALSVLVHEHFHAAVATGLDRAGRAAMGALIENDWAKAKALNEATKASDCPARVLPVTDVCYLIYCQQRNLLYLQH